ncbi:MAG: helix-turn-helix transcriptional regulator [Gammaproteobacteria bacterium]|nr:helix-turn-helix transcriptional regulator [Gammaproteobacteria bacterium]
MGSSKSLHTSRYQKFLVRLRQARAEAGMTQVELAKAVRRSQTWVSKCELGERRVDAVELEDIAKALGKPMEWFGTNAGESK